MRVLVTGSTGLIGSALVNALRAEKHEVICLIRSTPRAKDEIIWDPAAGKIDPEAIEGFDVVVHLAGENLAGIWTEEKKARICDSRIQSTRLLADTLSRLRRKPKVFISVSAAGYYGDRGDELLAEDSTPGTGFLADVCRRWEAASELAARAGIRMVNPRLGVVLSSKGGVLGVMLPAFKLGFGGRFGSGKQYMSWIAIDDVVGAFRHIIATESLAGPVNVATPHSVTNREFTEVLGRVLNRPTIVAVPEPILRLAPGEMAHEALLASVRLEPVLLVQSGYCFLYPELEAALRHLLRRERQEVTAGMSERDHGV